MWKALSILSLFCIFMRMCTSGQKRTMRFDTGENFYTCIYFSILFLYVSLDRKKCEWNYVGSLNEVVIARKSKHTHLKYVFLRKKNFKNFITISKRNQYSTLQEECHSENKIIHLCGFKQCTSSPKEKDHFHWYFRKQEVEITQGPFLRRYGSWK